MLDRRPLPVRDVRCATGPKQTAKPRPAGGAAFRDLCRDIPVPGQSLPGLHPHAGCDLRALVYRQQPRASAARAHPRAWTNALDSGAGVLLCSVVLLPSLTPAAVHAPAKAANCRQAALHSLQRLQYGAHCSARSPASPFSTGSEECARGGSEINTALEQPAAGLLLQGLIGCRVLRRGRSGSAAVPRPAPRYAGA